jgi:hypothetical protein
MSSSADADKRQVLCSVSISIDSFDQPTDGSGLWFLNAGDIDSRGPTMLNACSSVAMKLARCFKGLAVT